MPSKKRGGGKDTESPTAALVSDADASDDDYGTVDDGTTGHPETDRETLLPNNNSLVVEPEAETLGWRTIFVCSFTTLGGFIFGYDTGVIGGIIEMEGFRTTMGFPLKVNGEDDDEETANKLGLVVAILSLGCFVGAITAGQLADRFGRKWTTFWGGVTATIGAVVQASAMNLLAMYAGRFVCGIGVGTLSSIVPLYNAEVAPKHVRGFLVALQQLAITFGIMVAFLANFGLEATHQGWRVSLWLQAVASGVLLLGAPFLPETPRWLLSQGRTNEAVTALVAVRPNLVGERARAMIGEIKRSLDDEAVGSDASWSGLLVWPKRYRLLLGMGVMIGSQLTGINAIIYYAPTIFATVGIEPFIATAVVGVVNFLSTFIGLYALDRAGRKILLVYGAIGMFLSFLGIVILLVTDNAGVVVVVLVTLYTACFAAGWGPTGWVYISEIFPMAGRGKAVGAASASNWAISTMLAWATPLMLREDGGLGLVGTFSFYAGFCLINALFVLFFCAETKGKSLEEIGELFAVPLHPLAVGNYKSFFSKSRHAPPVVVHQYHSDAYAPEMANGASSSDSTDT